MYDVNLKDYPRLPQDQSDLERLRRAVDDCPRGVLYIPQGVYLLHDMLTISNCCSLHLHKSAVLKAAAAMPFLQRYGVHVPAVALRVDEYRDACLRTWGNKFSAKILKNQKKPKESAFLTFSRAHFMLFWPLQRHHHFVMYICVRL